MVSTPSSNELSDDGPRSLLTSDRLAGCFVKAASQVIGEIANCRNLSLFFQCHPPTFDDLKHFLGYIQQLVFRVATTNKIPFDEEDEDFVFDLVDAMPDYIERAPGFMI